MNARTVAVHLAVAVAAQLIAAYLVKQLQLRQ